MEGDTSIQIRAATPREAAVGAHLILLSGPTVFSYSLARSEDEAERLLAGLWPCRGHLFSYEWCHLAVVDGQVQGLLLAYPGSRLAAAGLATARHFPKGAGLRDLWRMARNGWQVVRISRPVRRLDLYIAHLAVLPGARSRGIGRRLLAAAERLAAEAGCLRCAIDVFIENQRARALYERVGYTVTHIMRNPRLGPGTGYSGLLRLVKPLDRARERPDDRASPLPGGEGIGTIIGTR